MNSTKSVALLCVFLGAAVLVLHREPADDGLAIVIPESNSIDFKEDANQSSGQSTPQKNDAVTQFLIVPHTIRNCSWCEYDRVQIFPKWRNMGYTIADPIDESPGITGNRYPWYEIYGQDGERVVHVGSLSKLR